ncbi:MAG TPA: iron chelate uptake ABC transporter family permease subunit [Chthoniobacteraceae bacterium]|jgi:ABC-type Mn2+/Zn2+ transport system permease subunit/Mn-dependent DtxR family transcriptional regulator|nr:iron chelate uptake ABC transporter family permease subunit [Chthoniobacteraceae bacterium]
MSFRSAALLVLITLLCVTPAEAAKISDVVETGTLEQARRFFSLTDNSLRYALFGSILLGISCGLLGSFLVVRKMALVGDALSHAVLPGVALGFLWNMTKDPVAIFIGATSAGLFGTLVVGWITRTTRLKEDAALGLVLASFFAVGGCLVTMIQRLPTGSKSGIDKFLFGQAAALSSQDVTLMAASTALTVILLVLFYKEFLVTSFDPVFARVTGMPVRLLQELMMLLLAFSVVVALQAVGVVLVSAMLITPAAAAYLLTDRMHRMLILAALFGSLAGVVGAFFSFLGNNLPTGPFMVLGASTVFGTAFFFAPRHGVVPRWWRRRSRGNRISRENTLKAIYRVLEDRGFSDEGVTLEELSALRRDTLVEIRLQAAALAQNGLATVDEPRGTIHLTPQGWRQACAVVRNHRLWELYLTNAAHYQADHVHEDAERIEHVLGEETVRHLERRLEFPHHDPHGRIIPSLREFDRYDAQRAPEKPSGYRQQ